MQNIRRQGEPVEKVVISDSLRVLIYGAVFVGLLVCVLNSFFDPKVEKDVAVLVLAGLLVLLAFLLFLANMRGYVVDAENDTFTYPGGGIAADSFIDYFNPGFWLQWFRRYQIPLSQVRHAESSDSVKTKVNDKGKVSRKRRYLIDIDGDFGAVRFCFMSKGKRDQLYSALVVANHMGRPVNLN